MLVVPVLALWLGCSGNKSSDIEVTYNCAANAIDIKALESEIPRFADTTGIHIALQPFTGQEKLFAMMAAGQAPDIFYTNAAIRDRLAAEGRLLDLRSVSRDDPFIGRLWPDILEAGIAVDSGLYSIGNWVFTAGVYYNKDLFDEAGIPYPDTTWTWKDLKAIARKLTRRGNNGERYGIFIGSHFVELIEQMNGARFGSLFLDLPQESVAAYREYLSLMEEGVMPDLRRMQAMGMQAVQLLQRKKVAMLVESVPNQTLFETLKMRWGIAPIPRFASKPVRYFRSSNGGLSVSAHVAYPHAVWRALKWIIGGASIYQPNPVLRDADFVKGWEERYPALVGSGFREVWGWSIEHNAGDPRLFSRFSSWSSGTILERLQPLLDRVWARELPVDSLAASVPAINRAVTEELRRVALRTDIKQEFLRQIRKELDSAPQL
jgi:ABC-type glycerol-3-phosphate transport system substrate-binding protein